MADTSVGRIPLSDRMIAQLAGPAKVGDGRGLWLKITPLGAKSWSLRYTKDGRASELGLGRYPDITIDAARAKAATLRASIAGGTAPVTGRTQASSAVDTFDERADAYIDAQKAGWSNAKHAAQWQATLNTYASPVLGRTPVDQITTADVLKVLKPIWSAKPETASRVRGRIEAVLDSAKALGMRSGDNPARWADGGLKQLLPAKTKIRKVKHHAALHYDDLGKFWPQLQRQPGVAAKALQFLILTAARTSEVTGARWTEVDLKAKVWTVPASRMKAGKVHRVPLNKAAVALLQTMRDEGTAGYIFKGPKGPLSNMAMLSLLQEPDRMNQPDITVHGFRSTFSDWASEIAPTTSTAVVEACLAHAVANKVEAAYRRGDLFDRRLELMAHWDSFITLA